MTPDEICGTYQRTVEAGDEDAWQKIWSADLPQIIVVTPAGTMVYNGLDEVTKLIFGAKGILGNPAFSDLRIYLTDDPRRFYWRAHIDFRARDGAMFDNDILIEMTLDASGKIRLFREFADPERRGKLFAYIKSKQGQST